MILTSKNLIEKDIVITNGKGAPAQVGYDLTVKEIKLVRGGKILKDKTIIEEYISLVPENGIYEIPRGAYVVTFEQGINLPNGITAFVIQRSSLKRIGGSIQSPVFDPGFQTEFIGTIMNVDHHISIEQGARIAQLVAFESHLGELYDGQFQGEKDVK